MSIVETLKRGFDEGYDAEAQSEPYQGITFDTCVLSGLRAALRSVKPSDISDEMANAFMAAWKLPGEDDALRRAIAAAIAKGGEA